MRFIAWQAVFYDFSRSSERLLLFLILIDFFFFASYN